MVIQIDRLQEPVSFPKEKSEWHSFLEGNVEKALKIRNHVEDLPETSATWRLNDVPGLDPQGVHRGIVKIAGSWKAPEIITNNRDRHWVNPNYKYAQHYAGVAVQCECGIPVVRQQFGPDEEQPAHHQEHNEDCNNIYRKEAELKILKNKKRIVKDLYAHGHSPSGKIERLGYAKTNDFTGGDARALGLNLTELAREGRKRLARTCMVLCREHSTRDIAKIFGLSPTALSSIITKETKSDASVLYSIRRLA